MKYLIFLFFVSCATHQERIPSSESDRLQGELQTLFETVEHKDADYFQYSKDRNTYMDNNWWKGSNYYVCKKAEKYSILSEPRNSKALSVTKLYEKCHLISKTDYTKFTDPD